MISILSYLLCWYGDISDIVYHIYSMILIIYLWYLASHVSIVLRCINENHIMGIESWSAKEPRNQETSGVEESTKTSTEAEVFSSNFRGWNDTYIYMYYIYIYKWLRKKSSNESEKSEKSNRNHNISMMFFSFSRQLFFTITAILHDVERHLFHLCGIAVLALRQKENWPMELTRVFFHGKTIIHTEICLNENSFVEFDIAMESPI